MNATQDTALKVSAATLNPLVHAVYPMEAVTRWHQMNHITGLTGRWMDTGATALGGAVRGPWHRLAHGHELFGDGLKVIMHPQLKFGEFLHHLGLDLFTKTGIPNPAIPKALGELLMRSGLPRSVAAELLTVNVPKLLGGGLGLVCSGLDVYAVFSDAIPHTLTAAGRHFLIGALEIAFGCYPPNPLLLAAGGAELAVSTITAVRAMCEPVVTMTPLFAFMPWIGSSVLLSGLFAAGAGAALGRSRDQIVKSTAVSVSAASVSTSVAAAAKAGGYSLALAGPLAGVATSCLMYYLLKRRQPVPVRYVPFAAGRLFGSGIAPAIALPGSPIGRVEGNSVRAF